MCGSCKLVTAPSFSFYIKMMNGKNSSGLKFKAQHKKTHVFWKIESIQAVQCESYAWLHACISIDKVRVIAGWENYQPLEKSRNTSQTAEK